MHLEKCLVRTVLFDTRQARKRHVADIIIKHRFIRSTFRGICGQSRIRSLQLSKVSEAGKKKEERSKAMR